MGKLATAPFGCPSCNTSYRLAYAKAESQPEERDVQCVACGTPFPQWQGPLVLRYFAVDETGRRGRENL
jgi:predicted Zn finger-like uncharacterized protein